MLDVNGSDQQCGRTVTHRIIGVYNFQPPENLDLTTMKSSWQDHRVEKARYAEKRIPQNGLKSASTEIAMVHITSEQNNSDLNVGARKNTVTHSVASKSEHGSHQKTQDVKNEGHRKMRNITRTSLDVESPPVMMSLAKEGTVKQTSGPPNSSLRTPTGATLQTLQALSDDRSCGSSVDGMSGVDGR